MPALVGLLLSPGCLPVAIPAPTTMPTPTIMLEATSEPSATPVPTHTPSPTPLPDLTFWISPSLPKPLRDAVGNLEQLIQVDQPEQALFWLAPDIIDPAGKAPLADIHWIYVLVAPFPTLLDGITSNELLSYWSGGEGGSLEGQTFVIDQDTLAAMKSLLGEPAPGRVEVLTSDQLLAEAWARPAVLSIVPFERLDPRWKTIAIDGQLPVLRDFDKVVYPLTAHFQLLGDPGSENILLSRTGLDATSLLPSTNRESQQLTVLAMTGVTALVRATAYRMEIYGVDYPGLDIRDWLVTPDLTHISNEIPFTENCPYPDAFQVNLQFCSRPGYIDLLDSVGADIIEMTGNHMMDWGSEALAYTIDLYRQKGWVAYAAGMSLRDAQSPVLLEHNGNRLAFIGCNPAGPSSDWASEDHPGSAPCGDYGWIKEQITLLRGEGYLPIVTLQYFEDYSLSTNSTMIEDFHQLGDAGAVIIQGSQAHTPKGFDFYNGSLIHYGLGNLFFDQMEVYFGDYLVEGTRLEFIDYHIFYANRHISTILLTAMLEDYARPRPMLPGERNQFLSTIFSLSNWRNP